MTIVNFRSTNLETFQKIPDLEKVYVGPLSEIKDSKIDGNLIVEHFSTINRSTVGKYCGLGVSSFVSDAKIGRYNSIGSRVSIGGFEHPINWLSTSSWQWGQGLERFDEIIQKNVFYEPKPIPDLTTIGSDCWIGNNSVILSGVSIGHGAVIGAGAVVSKNVEPYAIVVGNPAKLLKYRFDIKTIQRLLESQWFEKDFSELLKLGLTNFSQVEKCLESLGI